MDQETHEKVPLNVSTEVDDEGYTHAFASFGANVTFRTKAEGKGISRSPQQALSYALQDLANLVAKWG